MAEAVERGRTATVVLCDADEQVLGSLAPVQLEAPWWPEVWDVVAAVRERDALDIVVLRLIAHERPRPHGGHVTYLAQVDPSTVRRGLLTDAPTPTLTDDPLRATWARPGGPQSHVAWAYDVLGRQGIEITAPTVQQKSWNLSTLWRFSTSTGAMWLKVVPPFFAHEGSVIERLAVRHADSVPRLFGHDGARTLMAEEPGGDHWDADVRVHEQMLSVLVAVQAECAGFTDKLLDDGASDWRGDAFVPLADDVVRRHAAELDGETVAALHRLVHDLPRRFARLVDCGLPDSLVHGDFHCGNVVGEAQRLVVIDWGDSGVAHPLFDRPAFLAGVDQGDLVRVDALWADLWRDAVPGSDPASAAAMIAVIAPLRQAIIYRSFLDQIEDSERVYHRDDPREWLQRAVTDVTATT